jgi:L-aspartate oxidase
LRGEGATLINRDGERFMTKLHADAELAPRDVVARGVFAEIAAGRGAYLDCRESIGVRFPDAFPTVYAHARNAGLDPVRDVLPVAPAEHYHMGGIATDEHGRTTVAGLWAVGEVASTGLHGANRLASNSLLEAVVFGARVAADIAALPKLPTGARIALRPTRLAPIRQLDPLRRIEWLRLLRKTMSEHAGVVRSADGLRKALAVIRSVATEAGADAHLKAKATAAELVAGMALLRTESRGGHFRADAPQANPAQAHRSFTDLASLREALTKLDAERHVCGGSR